MHKILTILLLIIIGIGNAYSSEDYNIITDINIAKAEAVKTKTNLLLIFTDDACIPCGKLKKEIERNIDEEISKKYTVCYVDYSTNPELAKQYEVRQIPYSVVIEKNKAYVGFREYSQYKKWLEL